MKQALQALKVLIAVVPFIRSLMKQVEVPGSGAEKKAAVLQGLSEAINKLPWELTDHVKEIVLDIAGIIIDIIVGVLNILGHDWGERE